MYFRKIPYVANFDFLKRFKPGSPSSIGKKKYEITVSEYRGTIFRICCKGPAWSRSASQAGLRLPPTIKNISDEYAHLQADRDFSIRITGPGNRTLLSSPTGMTFGVCGDSHVFVFNQEPHYQFYGMGEKMRGFELSGVQTKFWNTDIFADFNWQEIEQGHPDPMYA